jgi:hypothetical protein
MMLWLHDVVAAAAAAAVVGVSVFGPLSLLLLLLLLYCCLGSCRLLISRLCSDLDTTQPSAVLPLLLQNQCCCS